MAHEISTASLPVSLALVVGYGVGKRKFIDSQNVSSVNHLVMVFAIPASLFVSISSKSRSDITSHGNCIAVIVIDMLIVYAVTLWFQLKVFRLDQGAGAGQAPTVAFRTRVHRAAAVLRRHR